MKKWMMRAAVIFLMLIAAAGLAACRQKETAPMSAPEGTIRIYSLSRMAPKLTVSNYTPEETDPDGQVRELLDILTRKKEGEDTDTRTLFPEGVEILGTFREQNVLTLNFNLNYNSMDPEREVLCRAALARTLTQVEGVDYILITCEGQPITDARGNTVGTIAGSDFLDSISDVNSFERVDLTLYFADADGKGLITEPREVFHNMNTSQERIVVEELIAGSEAGNGSVLPSGTKVLNVSVTDGICYVNLDSSFLNQELPARGETVIYALVNSLTELKNINRVQITADGQADVLYRGSISLQKPFERDESYIVR